MPKRIFSLRFKIILLVETIIIVSLLGVFYWMHTFYRQAVYQKIESQAKSVFNQLVLTRQWLAQHAGIYVEKKDGIETNPFLKEIPGIKPEITDSEGRVYTLRNPALVTKEVSVLGRQENLFQFHITSLFLINPENKADEFEIKALKSFERGTKETAEFASLAGKAVYRYMAPLYITPECLTCHGYQHYKVGDVRGGISVTIPVQEVMAGFRTVQARQWLVLGIVTLAVFILLFLVINNTILKPIDRMHTTVDAVERGGDCPKNTVLTNDELQDLSEAIGKMCVTIKEAEERLVKTEKLTAIGTLTAGIGHELRNPLMSIKTLIYFIKRKLENARTAEDIDEIKKSLRMIDERINASERIIYTLLNFAKTAELNLTPTNIPEILKTILSEFPAPENVRVQENIALLPLVSADAEKLKIVFSNLVVNGYQSMGGKGGVLTLAARYNEGMIEVEVSDTGSGIPKENLAKLFEPLFTTKSQGIGLGLAVCRTIIERHSGQISVTSEQNIGTSFIVKLPVKSA